MSKLKTGLFIGGFVAFTAAAMIPVFVYPRLRPEVYSTCRSIFNYLSSDPIMKMSIDP